MCVNTLINQNKIEFEYFFYKLLRKNLKKTILTKAMLYAATNGGKRIRPFLVMIGGNITKCKKSQYLRLASAIECIHSYTLIHDDLPSMDNDDYRRGKLSTHKKFDEATAILAGDALHDYAFEIIADPLTVKNPEKRISLIDYLSKNIGHKGLAGGQSQDILYENKKMSKKKIIKMYELKTSSLFEFSIAAPFILTGYPKNVINFYKNYGKLFGIIFQITDDLMDNEKNFKTLGKTPGKDKKLKKSTVLTYMSKNEAIYYCENKIKIFIKENKKFFNSNHLLEDILQYILRRIEN